MNDPLIVDTSNGPVRGIERRHRLGLAGHPLRRTADG